jgi:hypothetical protein
MHKKHNPGLGCVFYAKLMRMAQALLEDCA